MTHVQRLTLIRICWRYALLLLGVIFLVRLALLLYLPASRVADLVEYLYDDGYYYLAVAANLADSAKSTFDGLTLTNGYQPLWLLLLSLVAKLVGTSPHTLLVADCVLIYLTAWGALLLAGGLRRAEHRNMAMALAVGLAVMMLRWPLALLQGLETVLILPLSIPLVLLIEQAEERQLLWVSALLATMLLVRLDYLALYGAAVAVLALRLCYPQPPPWPGGASGTVRIIGKLSVFVLPTLAIYLVVNQWLFGSAVPVSGLAKSLGGPTFSNWGVWRNFLGPAEESPFLLLILLVLEGITRSIARPQPWFYRSICLFAIAAAAQCLYFCTLYTWYVMPWYECSVMMVAALIVARIVYLSAELAASMASGRVVLRALALIPVAMLGVWMAYWAGVLLDKSVPLEVRMVVRRTLQAGNPKVADIRTFNQVSLSMLDEFFDHRRRTLVAMGDRAGGIGFWGRDFVSVLQLEGLMLDRGYIQALREHRGEQYLTENFPIETLIIDREVVLKLISPSGEPEYVIPEPVRGRVTNEPVPTFCFPESAVQYQRTYETFTGVETRMAFDFSKRVDCSQSSLQALRTIEQGIGLQRYSLPGEYDTNGGFADTQLEIRDRRRALPIAP